MYVKLLNRLGLKFIVGGDDNAKHPWWRSRLTNPKGRELYKCIASGPLCILSSGSLTYWISDPRKTPYVSDFILYRGVSDQLLDIISKNHLTILKTLITVFNTIV